MKDLTRRTDTRIPDLAVVSEGRFFLIPMAKWNRFNEEQEALICVHDCTGTSQAPYFVSANIDETCAFCGLLAPEKIQTLFVLHNGHY